MPPVRAKVPYLVQISSSVVNSAAIDCYTESKKAQEKIALESGIPCVVLRPTLMFGWFDRKHLGWLARFMARMPVFPVPGHGRYLRQPLYAGDFCDIIMACIERRITGRVQHLRAGADRLHRPDPCPARHARLKRADRQGALPAVLGDAQGLRPVRQESALHRQAARGARDAGRLRDHRLAGHLRRQGDAARRSALRETYLHPVYSKIVLEF